MNLSVKKLVFSSLLSFSLCCIPAMGNIFLDGVEDKQDQIASVSPKKRVTHKSPLEFKQAVARYIKHTDNHCFQISHRHADENVSYKKELRYLFKNYGKFSTAALLSRLRSAHQEMVKHESNVNSDVYKRYEQISSALLLICAQVFFNDARGQILEALHELDNLIAYWRYQYDHPVSYFFGKSPIKWVMGKNQEKELLHNLNSLERKQKELYTLLGALTGHIHVFTESGTTYSDCYVWIEELFVVLSSIKGSPIYNLDGSRFDAIAAQLESKVKYIGTLKNDCLASIAFAKKSSHFVRNWIAYTTLAVGTGYMMHYHAQHPEMLPAAFAGVQDSAKYLLVLLVDPLNKIHERMKKAFSPKVENEVKEKEAKKEVAEINKELESVFDEVSQKVNKIAFDPAQVPSSASLKELCDRLKKVGKEMVSEINEELAKSNTTVREDGLIILKEAIKEAKSPTDGILYSSSPYTFDEESVNEAARAKVLKKVEPIKQDGVVTNEKEVREYQEALANMYRTIDEISGQAKPNFTGFALQGKLALVKFLLRLDNDYLGPLRKYTDIIDLKILKEVELIADVGDNLGQRGDFLLNKVDYEIEEAKIIMHDLVNKIEREIEEAKVIMYGLEKDVRLNLGKIDTILQDQELTFWFASLSPLMLAYAGINKTYQWVTKKNYSPIRIALADINSLLIESAMQLDDHDYGKLVYLICKLRNKAQTLKGAVSDDFLVDVAKLESKAYTAQTKRDIVDNMFNKYAFLGRIIV